MATARTVRELIEGAFRRAGIYEIGETPEATETSNALKVFQDLIAEQSGTILAPITVTEGITLVVAQASYTVGENGTPSLNTQRPEQIIGSYVRSGSYDYPVEVVGEEYYRTLIDKTLSGMPEKIWYNPTAPNGTIYAYPVPDAADTLYIQSVKSLSEPTSLTQNLLDTVTIPRKYHNPLCWMLALEMCEEYGKAPSQLMVSRSEEGKRQLMAMNFSRKCNPVYIEAGVTTSRNRRGNILTY